VVLLLLSDCSVVTGVSLVSDGAQEGCWSTPGLAICQPWGLALGTAALWLGGVVGAGLGIGGVVAGRVKVLGLGFAFACGVIVLVVILSHTDGPAPWVDAFGVAGRRAAL